MPIYSGGGGGGGLTIPFDLVGGDSELALDASADLTFTGLHGSTADFTLLRSGQSTLAEIRSDGLVSLVGNGAAATAQNLAGTAGGSVSVKYGLLTFLNSAPASGDLFPGACALWFDKTNGAAKLMAKAQTDDGTVAQSSTPLATPIASGALPTVALVSGTGAQVVLNRDARTVTPITYNPTAGAAATCLVQISPDNVTYSTVGTETEPAGVAFDGTIHLLSVVVPAGWYIKLTATNATLGTTTYY